MTRMLRARLGDVVAQRQVVEHALGEVLDHEPVLIDALNGVRFPVIAAAMLVNLRFAGAG